MIGAFTNGIKMEKEFVKTQKPRLFRQDAKKICSLVQQSINKYSVERMDGLLKNAEFSWIFKQFYEHFNSEEGEKMILPTLQKVMSTRALKTAITKIYLKTQN